MVLFIFSFCVQTALAYAIKATGRWLVDTFSRMEGGEASGAMQVSAEIAWLAPVSAGLKAWCTVLACDGIEELRRCCGGSGCVQLHSVLRCAALFVFVWVVIEPEMARLQKCYPGAKVLFVCVKAFQV